MQDKERDDATELQANERVAISKRKGRASASARFAANVCVRVFFWLTVLLALAVIATIAAARFWVVPNADDFRPRIVEEISKLTNQRVAMGGISAGWNGWSPEFRVSKLQILDERGRTLLELPEVETTLSWRSLFVLEPRLSALTVRNPRVVVRRTSENQLTLAGIDVDLADSNPSDPAALEWLLRQRFVQIANGEIEWQDEWRKLPPLRLRDVNVRLVNDGAHHRVGLSATPSADIASPIQVRSEFVGSNLRAINEWDGSAYLRVDYANVAQLARYLPLPIEISRGDGGIQAWFDFENGKATAITTDLVVRDANVKFQSQMLGAIKSKTGEHASPAPAVQGDGNTEHNIANARRSEPIAVKALSGRLSWRESAAPSASTLAALVTTSAHAPLQQRWSLRDVALTTAKGEALPPLSAELKFDRLGDALIGGEFHAAKIDLSAMTQLAEMFSMLIPNRWLAQLRESTPRGGLDSVVASWRVGENDTLRYNIAATLDRVVFQRGAFPGVSGLSGKLKLSDSDGNFKFSEATSGYLASIAKNLVGKKERAKDATITTAPQADAAALLVLDFGALFTEPLRLGSVSGDLDWKLLSAATAAAANAPARRAVWQIRSDGLALDGDDAKGKFAGSWQSDEMGPGVAKISGKFDRLLATAIHKYLPSGVDSGTRTWVRAGILDGKASNVTFALEGALWHFPFPDGKLGKFEIVAPFTDATLDYADGWPRAERVDAVTSFRGSSMVAEISRATISGATLGATRISIADMAHSPVLDIRGSAASTLDNFLRFVESSPVNRLLDRFTEGAKASGSARLNLNLSIPIEHAEKTKVDGEFIFENNRLDLGAEIPVLENVAGRLRFSEREARAKDIAVNAFGGAATLNVVTENGIIRTTASGRAELARVRERFDYPLLDQLKGQASWSMEMQTTRNAGDGEAIKLTGTIAPQALAIDSVFQSAITPRDATQSIPFSFSRTALAQGRDRIEFELPAQLHAILERSAEKVGASRIVERAVVNLGAQKSALPARGYSVRGDLAKLDADAALALVPLLTGSNAKNVGGVKAETTSSDFVNVALTVDRAIVFSHVLTDATLRAQPSGQRWRLALRSKEASGAIAIDSAEDGSGTVDAVAVRLQRFVWPSAASDTDRIAAVAQTSAAAAQTKGRQTRWPKLDLVADAFVSEGRELGRLEIKAQPSANEWRIETVKLTSPDGTLTAKGRWQLGAPNATAAFDGQSSVDVSLAWKDAGRFMQRFGLPKGVERGEGELNGEINWPGSPASFAYERLGGKFTLKTGVGRFSEMEPGIAKLLGVISLQSLPRRLSFNFDDLFGRGFAFDSIVAAVSIASGKASTDAFEITGPAARVDIRGSADLNMETAQLRVRVFPSISVATAIGVGLATANPAIGAAAWLGQKIARDPVERLLMQEFDVSGPWASPEVKQTRGMNAVSGENASPSPGTN